MSRKKEESKTDTAALIHPNEQQTQWKNGTVYYKAQLKYYKRRVR